MLISGCFGENALTDEKPVITVSILPQKYFVDKIAGDKVVVNVMVPPGASPSTYDPTPLQLQQLNKSLAYFRIGHIGFEEAWMNNISQINPTMKIYDLSDGVEFHSSSHYHNDLHSSVDPHFWLSPKQVKTLIMNIYNAMVELVPGDSLFYFNNFRRFSKKLDSLDRAFEMKLSQIENRHFIIYHPALTYFANDYGLMQHEIELEGKSPTPLYLKQIIDIARRENIKIIFIQKEFDAENARKIADEIGGKIVQINPLDEDWEQQINYITDQVTAINK